MLSASGDVTQRSILSYRRVQEYSADQAGVRFLTATKQSAKGMLTTFKKFAEDEMLSGVGNNASYAISSLAQNAHSSAYCRITGDR